MADEGKSRQQLLAELTALRARVAALEAADAARQRAEEAFEQSRAMLQNARDELERRVAQRTSELTRANEELAIFRTFAETSGQGFSMADLEGQITYLNPAMCRMLGETRPEDVIGKHLSAHFSVEDIRRGDEEIRPALRQEGRWQGELPMLTRQGTPIPTWHNTFVIRNERGEPHRMAVVITDITERKKAEEELRQSRDELQIIYDGMADGLVIVDMETTKPVRVNPALCQMLGYSEEELKCMAGPQLTPPEERPRVLEHFRTVLRGAEPRIDGIPFLRKDGTVLYADVVGKRVSYNGRPCLISFLHDVTERRRTQEALQRGQRALEHMLRASDHERQVIAYDIHDGLAQQITAAIMQFQAYAHLKENQPGKAQVAFDAGSEMLQMAHAEARRLISGVRPPVLDEAGLEMAVAHLVHDRRAAQGTKIEYKSEVQFDRLPAILENALYRIAQESLANACKHSQSRRVRVNLSQDRETIRLEVQDWGAGFDPQTVAEGRFGLEGIRERVGLLGGRLLIDAGPGRGTLIRVEVPLVEREGPS